MHAHFLTNEIAHVGPRKYSPRSAVSMRGTSQDKWERGLGGNFRSNTRVIFSADAFLSALFNSFFSFFYRELTSLGLIMNFSPAVNYSPFLV